MGASESTSRSNATNEEEEDNSQQQNNNSGGSFIGAAVAATAIAGVAVAAYGISKMLSDNQNNQQRAQNEIEPASYNSRNLIASGAGMKHRSKWSPPPTGRYKMNTDGGCHPVCSDVDDGVQRGPSGYGGILRDHNGKWVQGFIGFIGEYSDSLTSEVYGILKGLEVLDKLKLKRAILETDCQSAYEWVTRHDDRRGRSNIVGECWWMILECRQLAEKNEVDISLVTRDDANRCADMLASMAIERKEKYVEIEDLEDVPYGLRVLVEKDAYGISKMLSDNQNNQQRAQNEIEPASYNSRNLIATCEGMKSRSKYKMNTDGGCRPIGSDDDGVQRGPSGYGGILRDHNGKWVLGFMGFIGEKSDCLTSEFHGILKGLEVLDKLKLKGAILETDCQAAHKWVTGNVDRPIRSKIVRACWSMILECKRLAEKNDVDICHVTGDDANQCADKLASMAIQRKEKYVEIKDFEDVPYGLRVLVEKDATSFNV